MPPIPVLAGAYANLATEEWILQEQQQIRSLYDVRFVDFQQCYVDDVSWLNEYMAGLCESAPTKRDMLQAMKTPSRLKSVRKLNTTIDPKTVKPVGRLFSDASATASSSRTASSSTEPANIVEGDEERLPLATTTHTERRGSMIIHRDPEEGNRVEVMSTINTIENFEDVHKSPIPVAEPFQPLNEIVEVEEEDDDVVTVLKTPSKAPLAKPGSPDEEDLLESPLAGKCLPSRHEQMDLDESDKENVLSPVKKIETATPPLSDRSDSYVTALTSLPPEVNPSSQESQLRSSTLRPIDEPVDKSLEAEETIFETQVPLATSPQEHQMQLPSLPTRAPLNMKKSLGARKSQRTSLMESLTGRTSIIPNRMTLFGQLMQTSEQSTKIPDSQPAPIETTLPITAVPVKEASNPQTTEEPREEKEKDDTITIIDTELHLGDQRLKSKFTTDSQRIHDALNSLRTKSTPGQAPRDVQESIMEVETPAPTRTSEGQQKDDEDWLPKKENSSLVERLATVPPKDYDIPEEFIKSVDSEIHQNIPDNQASQADVTSIAEKPPSPSQAPTSADLQTAPPLAPSISPHFKSAQELADEAVSNAMALISNSSPQKMVSIYPPLTHDPILDMDPNENCTIHYDATDSRKSFESTRDSTYFTQSDVQSQTTQPEVVPPAPTTMAPPPRKDQAFVKPKVVPVNIRVPTASQRQKEQQKKALTQGTGIYPVLTQSRSVPDLASPGKIAREETRMSSVSVQSTGAAMRGGGQIKALNAARLAKQKEQQEREKKALKKFEMDRKRQEVMAKKQEEERRKQMPPRGRVISKDEKKRHVPAETLRPAKKLPPSPQKKQIREEPVKPSRPAAMPLPTNGLKHALEQEETRQKTANYTAAGKPVGGPQHVQDVKRRKTDEAEEKETITGKPMRVSVSVKQDVKPTKSIGEPIRHPYTAEPKKSIKVSSAHQYVHPAKGFMAPAEGVKFSNDPIAFGKSIASQGNRSGPGLPQSAKETPYPPSESIILPEIDSEYSDSEDDSPKKPSITIPTWAESPVLVAQLKRQQAINPDDVFGEIKPPAIDDIFRSNRRGHSTFRPRSSSANWNGQDKLTREEIEEYARTMGYSKP